MKTIFVLWNIILVIISTETEMRICMALSNKKSYDLIKVSKHDHTCFTQGLSIDKNILYESCGLHRKSNVRKINYETGEILKIIKLDPALFAEGITVVDNYLYMLTYKEKRIYVIDLITFQIFGFLRIQTITGNT
jgi:glutamine cyclotransferase